MSDTKPEILPDLYIKPEYDRASAEVSFSRPEGYGGGRWEVRQPAGQVSEGGLSAESGPLVYFPVAMAGFTPWSVHNPFLYLLVLKLMVHGSEVTICRRFGMSKVETRDNRVYFNNREIFLKGVIRGREAHDHPNLMNLSEPEYYRKYILAAKEYGFNFIRFHSRIPSDVYFEIADELGMLTHIEIRKYFGKYQKERKALDDLDDKNPELVDPEDWKKAVISVRNHPSMLVYCMGNEINTPGRNPSVRKTFELTRALDPNKLFLDTCGRGEYDRGNVDIDVKHMGYFCPWGSHHEMFDSANQCGVFGSVKGVKVYVDADPADKQQWKMQREIPVNFPLVAHEICHYGAYRDIDDLDRKFDKYSPQLKPWWIGELQKLIEKKGLKKDYYERGIESSRQWQLMWWKQGLESVRRSPLLAGYNFFQLSDTERYENSNSILDCFDENAFATAAEFMKFNADTVLIADFRERCFSGAAKLAIPVYLSNYDERLAGEAAFHWELKGRDAGTALMHGAMENISLDETGSRRICIVNLKLPALKKPGELVFRCWLQFADGRSVAENDWSLWVFPKETPALNLSKTVFNLDEIDLRKRYPELRKSARALPGKSLFIANRFDAGVLAHLDKGGDVLMLYRVPEVRSKFAPREKYWLPATQDRFKGTIWDRGHNFGGFIRRSKALAAFPNRGCMDFQFHRLVEDADKIALDDFPVRVEPIVQGNDKAARDRFDVHKFGLSELQPAYTLRKFAYLFELKVGKGRLLVSGFNFTALESHDAGVCALFESLLRYMQSGDFKPRAAIGAKALSDYLLVGGRAPRIKERMMTQYWQIDEEPVESARYWANSEAWLRSNTPY